MTLLQQLQQQQQQPPKKNTAKILANEIAELNQKGIYVYLNIILFVYVCYLHKNSIFH
jgi:hypothetical protein